MADKEEPGKALYQSFEEFSVRFYGPKEQSKTEKQQDDDATASFAKRLTRELVVRQK